MLAKIKLTPDDEGDPDEGDTQRPGIELALGGIGGFLEPSLDEDIVDQGRELQRKALEEARTSRDRPTCVGVHSVGRADHDAGVQTTLNDEVCRHDAVDLADLAAVPPKVADHNSCSDDSGRETRTHARVQENGRLMETTDFLPVLHKGHECPVEEEACPEKEPDLGHVETVLELKFGHVTLPFCVLFRPKPFGPTILQK